MRDGRLKGAQLFVNLTNDGWYPFSRLPLQHFFSRANSFSGNPDRKWLFQNSDIEELQNKQRKIFEDAFAFVKPNGHIVYATCSVLPVENEQQVDFFLKNFPVKLVGNPFHSFPKKGEMDGFFAATLQKY